VRADERARAAAGAGRAGAGLLGSAVRRRIVEHLDGLPRVAAEGRPRRDQGMSAAELAVLLGLHVTTVRFHLDQLLAGGLLDSHHVRSGSAGRPAKKYVVLDGDLAQIGRPAPDRAEDPVGEGAGEPYQVLAGLLAATLAEGDAARLNPEEAGREWVRQRVAERAAGAAPGDGPSGPGAGPHVGAAVTDLLREWGYRPQLSGGEEGSPLVVTLHDCPFLDLARAHPAVVCGIHRGLLRGALEAVGDTETEVSLHPFVDARTCQAVLAPPTDHAPERRSTR
jgi:predicted ArsR family transcriptional regulator